MVAYSVETHQLQMSFIHISGSQTHAKLGHYPGFSNCVRVAGNTSAMHRATELQEEPEYRLRMNSFP